MTTEHELDGRTQTGIRTQKLGVVSGNSRAAFDMTSPASAKLTIVSIQVTVVPAVVVNNGLKAPHTLKTTSVITAHVHPEPLLPTKFLPNTCNRARHNTSIISLITFFSQDHAFAGIGAGTVAVLCMNPLDLLKVKFQVSTRGPEGGIGRGIWRALCDIRASEGWRGLYRGLGPNVAGNASSWGLYFLLCVSLFPPLLERI
jgi:hypothetical protein